MTSSDKYDIFDSLDEMIDMIDMRLDLEFYLYGKRYNISTNKTPFITLCPDGETSHYKDGRDLVEKHEINGKRLKDIWKDIQLIGY